MSLSLGARLGPYEIQSALGAGGMGEVYRARDTKLGRDVALKILPDSFATDPERLARFQREAQVLASLNHPHIGAIYGLEESNDVRALVLELVEGPTLADRIAQGAISLDEALPIAKQIAEALEAAHEQGIIHRDLKPANIKVRDDGSVKVLDFGLAKALEPASVISPMMTASPTITTPAQMTGVGMILGTAAYMSPEQAKGRPADKRSDVWAFGCVLYEMLTGRRVFEGEDVSDTLAAVIRADPDWHELERRAGAPLTRVVRRCVTRDRTERLRDIGDAKWQLDEVSAWSPSDIVDHRALRIDSNTVAWRAAAIILIMAMVVVTPIVIVHLRERLADSPPIKFAITLPAGFSFGNFGARVALSRDGRTIAFVATDGASTVPRIFIRALDQQTIQPLRGTEGATGTPFWSPDGRELAFLSGTRLKRVSAAGGGAQTVCEVDRSDTFATSSGTWNTAGDIVFSTDGLTGLWRVAAGGGRPTLIAAPQRAKGETRYVYPDFAGDDAHFVFTAELGTASSVLNIGSLDGSSVTRLAEEAGHGVFVPPDQMTFWRGGVLFTQAFNARTRTLEGRPTAIVDDVTSGGFSRSDIRTAFSFSRTNVLAYEPGPDALQAQLTWVDRSGHELGAVGPPAAFSTMQFSPDEQFVAIGRRDDESGSTNIWIIDLRRNVTSRLTFGSDRESNPAWSPDGRRIAFNSQRNGQKNLYDMASSGGDEKLLAQASATNSPLSVSDRSKDGRFLIFNKDASHDLWVLPLTGGERTPSLLVHPPTGRADQPNFSPDGRFVAYNSDESGRAQVYVVPFPATGEKWQVSATGGVQPRWRGDGREIVYLAPDGTMMAADVMYERRFQTGTPHPLFRSPISPLFVTEQFAMTHDGQRFLIMKPITSSNEGASLTVIVNWSATLRR